MAAKMCNTEATSRNQSDSSYTYALEPEPSGSQKAEIGPIVPLRQIKLPTLGNLIPEAAATARRPFESYALPLSPQGFQDPPFLSRRPAPSVTQFSATSHTSVRRQLEADVQIQRAPADLGIFIPASVAENVPPMMELPSYELQGSVDDHWQDTILSWSLGQEAPAQQAVQPSYPWPEEQDWALPAHGPGANEGSRYTYDAPEIAPFGSYATSYEVEQWYRALAGQ
ncbi:hypothetical protein GY45DRAFT_327528 [Cubamyces sp. BRFM 1775]|nr:hypothetical protein GY45DRAFT_327528 [Cubamyces sp. BRFM 1775]